VTHLIIAGCINGALCDMVDEVLNGSKKPLISAL